MPPQPADKWEGVRSSRMFGPTCPQAVRMGWGADEHAFAFHWDDGYPGEDCLRVNIWTPGLNDGKKRPVMVWLHGGGYAAGSGQELPSYDGFNLAKKGDAVVQSGSMLRTMDAKYSRRIGAAVMDELGLKASQILEVVMAFPTRGF